MKQFILLMSVCLLALSGCKKDACETSNCQNGGICNDGRCDCPQGFYGSDCGQQITPQQIKISKIEVLKFPATDNGGGWDLTSGPEIYPKILKDGTTIWTSSIYYENADPSDTHQFSIDPSIQITEPKDRYTIALYDYDGTTANDYMGGVTFTPYSSNNKFPSTIRLDAGGEVVFKIYVSYVF
jgi:hypothetical protein